MMFLVVWHLLVLFIIQFCLKIKSWPLSDYYSIYLDLMRIDHPLDMRLSFYGKFVVQFVLSHRREKINSHYNSPAPEYLSLQRVLCFLFWLQYFRERTILLFNNCFRKFFLCKKRLLLPLSLPVNFKFVLLVPVEFVIQKVVHPNKSIRRGWHFFTWQLGARPHNNCILVGRLCPRCLPTSWK